MAFGTTVSARDQFGNTVTADSGRLISLSVVAVSPTTTTGTLSGTAVLNNVSGVSAFSGLSFNKQGTISLTVTASGLTSVASNNILVASSSTSTPFASCGLRNGILVKTADSPTVYMVVNCVLRPFTTPALFHARGKKFRDIITINSLLAIGRPVGEGNDDDDTIVNPPTPTATATLPNLANLPEGSIVKLPGNPTVYLVSGGTLQPFTSALVFRAHKKDFRNLQIISQDQFNSMTVGAPVGYPNGTLLKGSEHTIYVIQNGEKVAIPSLDSLKRHGQSLKDLLKVSDDDLDDIHKGGEQD